MALVVHQLSGSAKAWWDSYCDNHANPATSTWAEFCEAFREHHIPKMLLIQKAAEFRNMTQGSLRVEEHV